MPRERKDGRPRAKTRKVRFTTAFVRALKPGTERITIYDTDILGFAIRIEPSGHAAYKLTYRCHKKPRWLDLGAVGKYPGEEGLAIVRVKCLEHVLRMAKDPSYDPQANKVAARSDGSFEQDLSDYAKDCEARLKSFAQKIRFLTTVFLPAWRTTPTKALVRADVRHVLQKSGRTPKGQDAARRHLSAFFSWCAQNDRYEGVNPCLNIKIANSKIEKRKRTLTVEEMPLFWNALKVVRPDEARALKVILLTGARGGEVLAMRHEDVERITIGLPRKQRARLKAEGQLAPEQVTGFCWVQTGKPDAVWNRERKAGVPERKRRGWRGTKNGEDHAYWLPAAVVALIGEGKGQVFPQRRDLAKAMVKVCREMGVEAPDKIRPHDCRRTFSNMIGHVGFKDEQMHRVLNHTPHPLTETYSPERKLAEAWEITNTVVAELLQRASTPAAETSAG